MAEELVTGFWWWFCTLIYGVAMIVALYRSPWKRLFAHRVLQHLFLGLTVLLIGLWQMRAGLSPGLTIHVLGATMAALIFGWELGLLCLSLVLAAMTVVGRESWQAFPINAFVTCMIPVLLSYGHHLLIRRLLPKNFFVYFLATVFLGIL
ncbi:MAG: energy-coupling factor ABC transporter permease [Motiliproteus sp.]|nr:energy-coupling factor ABC transporter permease [Motiliproteus sp.]